MNKPKVKDKKSKRPYTKTHHKNIKPKKGREKADQTLGDKKRKERMAAREQREREKAEKLRLEQEAAGERERELEEERGTAVPRSQLQAALDRQGILRLIRRGWTPARIAERYGLTETQVNYDVRVILKELREATTKDREGLVSMKLEEYAEAKRAAWEAWEVSKGIKRKAVNKTLRGGKDGDGEERTETTLSEEEQCGDPRLLNVVLDCLEAERKLLGLDAPKEMKLTGQGAWDLLGGVLERAREQTDIIETEIQKALEERRGDTKVTAVLRSEDYNKTETAGHE